MTDTIREKEQSKEIKALEKIKKDFNHMLLELESYFYKNEPVGEMSYYLANELDKSIADIYDGMLESHGELSEKIIKKEVNEKDLENTFYTWDFDNGEIYDSREANLIGYLIEDVKTIYNLSRVLYRIDIVFTNTENDKKQKSMLGYEDIINTIIGIINHNKRLPLTDLKCAFNTLNNLIEYGKLKKF